MFRRGWPIQARVRLEWGCSDVTDFVRRAELEWPHVMGTNTFSPQWPKSFRHILLLPSPSLVYSRHQPPNLRVSLGAGAAELQTLRLRVRRHAGACPPPVQRTAIGEFPTQAKIGLEWATRCSS